MEAAEPLEGTKQGTDALDRGALAESLAAELCSLPASVWAGRSRGADTAFVAFIEDEPPLAEHVVVLWNLARSGPLPAGVLVRSGVAGAVVIVHDKDFSVVARSGGPALILSDHIRGVLRVDLDPSWHDELSALISELITVGQGGLPFDESAVPPPPRMPWHKDP